MNTDPLELAAPWLQPCGACDAGLPMACTHPDGDPRIVIAALVDALVAQFNRANEYARQANVLEWQDTDRSFADTANSDLSGNKLPEAVARAVAAEERANQAERQDLIEPNPVWSEAFILGFRKGTRDQRSAMLAALSGEGRDAPAAPAPAHALTCPCAPENAPVQSLSPRPCNCPVVIGGGYDEDAPVEAAPTEPEKALCGERLSMCVCVQPKGHEQPHRCGGSSHWPAPPVVAAPSGETP